MKKYNLSLIVLSAVVASVALGQNTASSDQPEFPKILLQPDNQMVPLGSNATFIVVAKNGPLTYQWLRNGVVLDGLTNSGMMILNVQIEDVGLYSCNVSKGLETVPTRAASLMVYTSSIDPETGVDPVTVFGFPLLSIGSQASCPGHYTGYVNYTKTVQQGWGWAPDTTNGNTIFVASDTNRTDTKLLYGGAYGDNNCNQTSIIVPSPAFSPVYRFTIYFTNNVPTNPYAITLDGFKP